MGRRFATWLVVGTLSIALVPGLYAKKKKDSEEAAPPPPKQDEIHVDTSKLVWPQPPDIGRIRWEKELKSEPKSAEEVEQQQKKKKKQGWMDRVAGVQVQEDSKKGSSRHHLMKPYGVVVDSKGRILVADSYVAAVFIFDLEQNKVSFIRNGIEGRFKTMIGLAIDDTDRLFVSDADLHHVSVFDTKGKFETSFGDDVLGRPSGMAIDNENRFLYVVDIGKQQIAVFDADNYKLLRYVGGPPKKVNDDSPGTFTKPSNVAVDADGNIFVADTFNNRIQIFDPDGNFISMFGKNGDAPGTFTRPKGVAVDHDGHVWVADAMQNRVQIFDREGHLLGYFGSFGTLPGQFGLATGMFIDKNNRVVVADQLKGRVQIFRYTTDDEVAAIKAGKAPATPPAAASNQGTPAAAAAAPAAAAPAPAEKK